MGWKLSLVVLGGEAKRERRHISVEVSRIIAYYITLGLGYWTRGWGGWALIRRGSAMLERLTPC